MTWKTWMLVSLMLATDVASSLDPNQLIAEVKPLLESLMEKNTLTYGSKCNYASEQEKQKYEKQLLNLMSTIRMEESFSLEQFKNKLVSIIKSISSIPTVFCNGYQNLQCNSDEVCACAGADESYGFKMSFQRDGNVCLIAPGSLCAPGELMEKSRLNNPFTTKPVQHEYRCAGNAVCIVKSNRGLCTLESMQTEFRRLEAEEGPVENPVEFFFQKAKEGVCVCKGTFSNFASPIFTLIMALLVLIKCLVY